ncbi:MAG TPA: GTPase (G3E family) [Roseburia sp.]|nr:GTPase (G3E family) [Roseburia sp.]
MVKIDLITGFLGSGKTTFLRKYASHLIAQGQNIGILENDFGAVNVDMMLLGDLRGDNCELEMISGGCDTDTHRRRFKTKLISMGMCGYDRVIVEPSGIYDVDEFFDTLYEEPLDGWYQIGNVITVLDSNLEEDLPEGAEFLLASQAANAGYVVLSKTQETTEEEQKNAVSHLNRSLKNIGCKRQFDEVFAKDWDKLTDEDFKQLLSCGYHMENYRKPDLTQKKTFQSLYFMNMHLTEKKLQQAAKKLFLDKSCGKIFRIKGFMKNEKEQWIEMNATKKNLVISPIKMGQEVIIVIGEQLDEDAIRSCLEA